MPLTLYKYSSQIHLLILPEKHELNVLWWCQERFFEAQIDHNISNRNIIVVSHVHFISFPSPFSCIFKVAANWDNTKSAERQGLYNRRDPGGLFCHKSPYCLSTSNVTWAAHAAPMSLAFECNQFKRPKIPNPEGRPGEDGSAEKPWQRSTGGLLL